MAFTLIGYSATTDSSASAGALISALADQHVAVSGNDITVPGLNFLAGYYAQGTNLTRCRIESPSLRKDINVEIAPLETGVSPGNATPVHDRFMFPAQLDKNEALEARAFASDSVASRKRIFVWLSDGKIDPVPAGKMVTIHATNTTTLAADAWTNGALTFSQTLPAGTYAVVGARAYSANLIAFRLVVPGYAYRPGAIGFSSYTNDDRQLFRNGHKGVWCTFTNLAPPTVDFYSSGADSSQTVFMDVIKIA